MLCYGCMFPDLFSWINFDLDAFLLLAGTNPFLAMWYLFIKGGWVLFLWIFLWGAKELYLEHIQEKAYHEKKWILLRVVVPKGSEQTPKAAEHIFANFAGTHGTYSFLETWVQGSTQSQMAIEIASIEGVVSYYIYAERKFRDLIEASIYAQYPDADIDEVEDYTRTVPSKYPDEEWDMFGCEMVPVKPDCYSLKTYVDFEDKVSGEYKDPSAAMLENFSRIGPGEQVWFQIVLYPTDQKESGERAKKEIEKIMGIKKEVKKTTLDHVIDLPITIMQEAGNVVGIGGKPAPKKEEKPTIAKMQTLSPGEVKVLESIQRKASKISFMCKIRFVYVAKKSVMKKPRALHPFIGAIKQTNTFDMQALKPETKKTGMNGTLVMFKNRRNIARQNRFMPAYRDRSPHVGMKLFSLSAEELATLWHFPILMQVKAPQLRRTEAKKMEAPQNLPFET